MYKRQVIFNSDEGVLGRDIVFGFLRTALFRSLAGMGIGYLVAAVVTGLKAVSYTHLCGQRKGRAQFA